MPLLSAQVTSHEDTYCIKAERCATFGVEVADTVAVLLSSEALSLARAAAEEQTPNSVILGSLRAQLRRTMERGPVLDAALATLHILHPDDVADLDDFRDDGRRKLHAVLYAAALAYALNRHAVRFDPDNPEHDPEDFAEVDGKQLAGAHFLGRYVLAIDPSALKEEAQREAERIAGMSTREQRELALQVLTAAGFPDEEIERLASSVGLELVQGGAA